jgi:hypothetical protein
MQRWVIWRKWLAVGGKKRAGGEAPPALLRLIVTQVYVTYLSFKEYNHHLQHQRLHSQTHL